LCEGEDESSERSDGAYDGEAERNSRILEERRTKAKGHVSRRVAFVLFRFGLTKSPPLILKNTQALTARLNPKERAMNWICEVLTESVIETEEKRKSTSSSNRHGFT